MSNNPIIFAGFDSKDFTICIQRKNTGLKIYAPHPLWIGIAIFLIARRMSDIDILDFESGEQEEWISFEDA